MNLENAEEFVSKKPNAYWDGWTMVMFKEADHAWMSPKGIWHDGKWGFANRIEPDEKGNYVIT